MEKGWTGPTKAQMKAQARIAAELGSIGFALPGSLASRTYKCGKPNCACAEDAAKAHGPYHQWSRWEGGRSRNTNLSEEQAADYKVFFDNSVRLRGLVEQLEALTNEVVSADPRLKQGRSRQAAPGGGKRSEP